MPNIMDENGNVVDISSNNVTSTNNGKINAQGIASALGGAASAFGTAYSTYADVQNPKDWVQRANAFQVGPNYGGSSFDSWTQAFLNNRPLAHIGLSDVGYNTGKGIMNALGAGVQGAGAGASIGGGWGALAGGIIGTIGGLFGMGAAKRKAQRTVNKANEAIDYTNAFNTASLNNSLNNIRNNQFNNLLRNYSAFGGPLNMSGDGVLSPFGSRFAFGGNAQTFNTHGGYFSNGVVEINEGKTHEENPYEGVQMGIDPQGVPNLVEEGEVIWNDYVFSNRMKVPKRDRIKYKLTGPKNLTYAEAAKKAQKESEERPNDPISKRGLEEAMTRLADSQEEQRQKEFMRELEKQAEELGMTPEELLYAMQQQQQQPVTAAYGGSIQVKKANFAKNAAGWKHGLGGNLFTPGGPMEQTYTGLGVPFNYFGWFPVNEDNSYLQPEEPEVNRTPSLTERVQNSEFWSNIPANKEVWLPGYGNVTKGQFAIDMKNRADTVTRNNTLGPSVVSGPDYDWFTGLRYTPILASAISGIRNLLTPADYSRANDVERAYSNINDIKVTPKYNYMQYRPIDRMIMANMIGQQAAATRRNIMNTSGGNRGTAIAELLASDNQYLNKLGEAFIAGDAKNYKRYAQTLDTNNKINQWLGQLDLGVQEANQRAAKARAKGVQLSRSMMDATDAQRAAAISNDWTNVAQGLGDIGWEQANRNMVNTSNPLYSIDSSGNVFYDPQKMIKALGDSDGRRWMVLKTKNDAGETTKAEEEELAQLYRKANTAVGGAYFGNVPVTRGKRAKGEYLTIKGRKK